MHKPRFVLVVNADAVRPWHLRVWRPMPLVGFIGGWVSPRSMWLHGKRVVLHCTAKQNHQHHCTQCTATLAMAKSRHHLSNHYTWCIKRICARKLVQNYWGQQAHSAVIRQYSTDLWCRVYTGNTRMQWPLCASTEISKISTYWDFVTRSVRTGTLFPCTFAPKEWTFYIGNFCFWKQKFSGTFTPRTFASGNFHSREWSPELWLFNRTITAFNTSYAATDFPHNILHCICFHSVH